jgi:hypothetical protein
MPTVAIAAGQSSFSRFYSITKMLRFYADQVEMWCNTPNTSQKGGARQHGKKGVA